MLEAAEVLAGRAGVFVGWVAADAAGRGEPSDMAAAGGAAGPRPTCGTGTPWPAAPSDALGLTVEARRDARGEPGPAAPPWGRPRRLPPSTSRQLATARRGGAWSRALPAAGRDPGAPLTVPPDPVLTVAINRALGRAPEDRRWWRRVLRLTGEGLELEDAQARAAVEERDEAVRRWTLRPARAELGAAA